MPGEGQALHNGEEDGLALLFQAAEYVEKSESKRHREFDHGYACKWPVEEEEEPSRKRMKNWKKNRTTHNELEKNRRAHLRHCLDSLKSVVPLGPDATRHTTLSLLNKATRLIKDLESRDQVFGKEKEKLERENRQLHLRLCGLQASSTCSSPVSECSTEAEDIDILDMSCSSGNELIQAISASNEASTMLLSMSEILVGSS